MADQGSGSDNRAEVPTDPNLLDRLERAVNDAAADLARRYRWSWLTPIVSITLYPDGDGPDNIDSAPGRYLLPSTIQSAPLGRVAWRDPTDSYGGQVTDTHISRLEEAAAAAPTAEGPPRLVAVWARVGGSTAIGQRPGLEMTVWPKPDLAYTVRARFRRQVSRMTDHAERGIWSEVHDPTVIALACAKFMRPTDTGYAEIRADADAKVSESIRIDQDMTGKRVGAVKSGDEAGPGAGFRSSRGDVNDHDGNSIISY